MKRYFPLLLVVFLLAGCSPAATQALTSGVEGNVTIGPTCPVEQIGNPCPDQPYQAYLTVLDARGRKVTRFQTDVNGYYREVLAPGNYVMHPESPGVMPHAVDQSFTIQADQFTTLNIIYDSGIR